MHHCCNVCVYLCDSLPLQQELGVLPSLVLSNRGKLCFQELYLDLSISEGGLCLRPPGFCPGTPLLLLLNDEVQIGELLLVMLTSLHSMQILHQGHILAAVFANLGRKRPGALLILNPCAQTRSVTDLHCLSAKSERTSSSSRCGAKIAQQLMLLAQALFAYA